MKKKILFLDKNHPIIFETLQSLGFEIQEDYHSNYQQVIEKIHQYEGLVIRSRIPIDKALLSRALSLQWIARVGAGMENIDTEFAENQGIKLFNAPEGNRDTLAEHLLGMLLGLMNRLFIASQEVKKGIWLREENRGEELMGKTIGLIGYGNMGKAVARRFSGFGVEVIFYDIKKNLADEFAREVTLQELKQKSDIISLHLPLTKETEYFIDDKFISEVEKKFYLINTARGKNVLTSSLVRALKQGKIKGAVLDVIEYEKTSFEGIDSKNQDFEYLLEASNVILTPHIAGWSIQSKEKLAQVIVDKIKNFYQK